MEQKRFDKKNLIVILALVALIGLVAATSMMLKPKIEPTLGELAADPTAVPAATEAPVEETTQENAEETEQESAAQMAQAYLVVTVAGAMYEPIPLYEEGRYTITRGDYVNTIAVTPNSIRMHESSCDNQDCVLQGEVTLENRHSRVLQNLIICLPNDVMLELYSPDELMAMLMEMMSYTGEETNE